MQKTFQTPDPVNLRVELWEGQATITAADTDTTTIELIPLRNDSTAEEVIANTRVEQHGDDVVVLMPKLKTGLFRHKGEVKATITVPTGSNVRFETGSADLEGRGVFGETQISTGSGDVALQHTGPARIKAGSGDISIDAVNGELDCKAGSGDLTVGSVDGDSQILSGSGDVRVGTSSASLKVKTGSGDIMVKDAYQLVDAMAGSGDLVIKRITEGRLKAKTGSGDVHVGVADGTAAFLDVMSVTGDVVSELGPTQGPADGDLKVEIVVQTGTGDVVLQRA